VTREARPGARDLLPILRHYRRLHEIAQQSGQGPYRMTSRGAWATSRIAHVYYFLKRLGLDRDRLFIDLGSGDGLVACVAGLFTRSVGIEADPDLCRTAAEAVQFLGMTDRVRIVCGDYLTMNLQRADCLYLYPDKPFAPLEQILASWPGRLLVYGPHIAPKQLVPELHLQCGRERLQVYRATSHTSSRQ
jgi:hypothetical protein